MKLGVTVKTICPLQSGDRKDGNGKWYARDIVLVLNDGAMYPDEFVVRLSGENAQNCSFRAGDVRVADISFSTRAYQGRMFQDLYLRNMEVPSNPNPFEPPY